MHWTGAEDDRHLQLLPSARALRGLEHLALDTCSSHPPPWAWPGPMSGRRELCKPCLDKPS
eukprot:14253904-Alexandrium_andersonii.AAC.1